MHTTYCLGFQRIHWHLRIRAKIGDEFARANQILKIRISLSQIRENTPDSSINFLSHHFVRSNGFQPAMYYHIKLQISALLLDRVDGEIVISKVAEMGTSGVCNDNNWLELHNAGSQDVNLEGFIHFPCIPRQQHSSSK